MALLQKQTLYNFISQSTTQGFFLDKKIPCSSEMAETRGDMMFLAIFLGCRKKRFFRHFLSIFPFFSLFLIIIDFFTCVTRQSRRFFQAKNQAIPDLWSPRDWFTF